MEEKSNNLKTQTNADADATQHEWILKQNEDYTFRFLSVSAGYVDYGIEILEYTHGT